MGSLPADNKDIPTSTAPTIYIIYNATSSMYGKINYVYRKVTCPDPESKPACAACELTHGPSIRLSESPQWIETKKRIHHAKVLQIHQNEMPAPLRTWMNSRGVSTPAVVAGIGDMDHHDRVFKVLLTAEDLAAVRHDHEMFLAKLKTRAAEENISGLVVDPAHLIYSQLSSD